MCLKFFPAEKPAKVKAWSPLYTLENGKTYTVPGVESDECPVSAITPQSRWLIEQEALNRHAKESAGACFYGTDINHWPARWFDTVTLLQMCRIAEDAARAKVK